MEFYLPLNYLFGNFLSNFATDCHFVLVGESFSFSACSVRLCHMQKREMGCRNRGWGQGTMHPPLILTNQVTLSNSGGQIMTTTLILVPPRNFRPSYSLGKKENLDKIPNGNTLLALACLDLVKTFIAMLLRFVILANSKQA